MLSFKDLQESLAHQQAHSLGLEYYGFGRYGHNNTVTHVNTAGRLTPLRKPIPSDQGEGNLTHYTHLEDQMIEKGVEGAQQAIDTLHKLIKDPQLHTQVKIDGSPNLNFGIHPDTGKFFIATKSLFNKNPKINYTHEDIERNHGDSPGLAAKLHVALDHLPKIYKGTNIMQGDMMFDRGDVDVRHIKGEKHFTFKPNIIRNAIPVNSHLGHQIAASKMGIAVHTQFNSRGERLPASNADVGNHSDVFLMPVDNHDVDLSSHAGALSAVGRHIAKTPREAFELVQNPEIQPYVMAYFNHTVKTNQHSSVDGLISFVGDSLSKKIEGVKTPAKRADLAKTRDHLVNNLIKNRQHLEAVLGAHTAVTNAKNAIIASLNEKQPVKRFFDVEGSSGLEDTGPEGYVAITHQGTSKLVQRHGGFSYKNFTQQKDWAPKGKKKEKHAVITLGRFSPPHVEHTNLINAVTTHATAQGAEPMVFTTHSFDNKKNPLTAAEKIELLQAAHPEHAGIFHSTSKDMPTMIHVLNMLHKKGYTHVDVILGDGRVEDFDFITKNNGKTDKRGTGYNFQQLNLINRHDVEKNDRPRAAGDDGIHASDVRAAAVRGDWETFRKAMNPKVSDALARKTMELIRQRLKQNVREDYIDGCTIAKGDIVVNRKTETIHEVLMCGTNYLTVSDEHGEVSKMWVEDAVVANQLAEDFYDARRRRSSSNQIAFVGYKTKNFTKEHYELFKPVLKEKVDRFLLLSLIRSTDQLLKETDDINEENYGKIKTLYEQSDRILKKINNGNAHVYRQTIADKINEYEIMEGLSITGYDKESVAKLIANTLNLPVLSTPEQTVQRAKHFVESKNYPEKAMFVLNNLFVAARKLGIK